MTSLKKKKNTPCPTLGVSYDVESRGNIGKMYILNKNMKNIYTERSCSTLFTAPLRISINLPCFSVFQCGEKSLHGHLPKSMQYICRLG